MNETLKKILVKAIAPTTRSKKELVKLMFEIQNIIYVKWLEEEEKDAECT